MYEKLLVCFALWFLTSIFAMGVGLSVQTICEEFNNKFSHTLHKVGHIIAMASFCSFTVELFIGTILSFIAFFVVVFE